MKSNQKALSAGHPATDAAIARRIYVPMATRLVVAFLLGVGVALATSGWSQVGVMPLPNMESCEAMLAAELNTKPVPQPAPGMRSDGFVLIDDATAQQLLDKRYGAGVMDFAGLDKFRGGVAILFQRKAKPSP